MNYEDPKLGDLYGIPPDAASDADPEYLKPDDQLASLITKLSKFGRIELPYRVAERSPSGIHLLEKGTLRRGIPKSYEPSKSEVAKLLKMDPEEALAFLAQKNEAEGSYADVIQAWRESLDPKFVSGEFTGQSAAGIMPDLERSINMTDAQAGKLYNEQIDRGLAFQDVMQNLPSLGRPGQSFSRMPRQTVVRENPLFGDITRMEQNPPGPGMMQSLLKRQYTGPEMLERQPNAELKISPELRKHSDDILDKQQEAFASATGETKPWRSISMGVETPGNVFSFSRGKMEPSQFFRNLIDTKEEVSPASLLLHPDMQASIDRVVGSTSKPIGTAVVNTAPGAQIPANAPIGGHLMESAAHDLVLPTTFRDFDPTSKAFFNKFDPIPWLASIKEGPLKERLIASQQSGIDRGVLKSMQPTIAQLINTDPDLAPLLRSQVGMDFGLSNKVLDRAQEGLSDLFMPMDKNYGAYSDPKAILSLQPGNKQGFINVSHPR